MTANEIIYEIYEDLNINSDDTNVDKRLILQKINTQRELWITNEMNKNFRMIPPALIQDIGCIPLEQVSSEDCCETQSDCFFMRTSIEIPAPINLHRELMFTRIGPRDKKQKEFTFISYDRVPYVGFGRFNHSGVYSFWLNNRVYLMSRNDSIVLFEGINVMGVFPEPENVVNLGLCEDEPCWTFDSQYPIYRKLWAYMKPQIVQELLPKMTIPQDNVNDGDTKEIRGQAQ